jgi:hypothetical protein
MPNRSNRGNLVIYIFPYLFLEEEQIIDGFTFKPSYSATFDSESTRIRGHLTRIARSFTFKNANNINQYTYGYVTIHNSEEWLDLKKSLDKLSTILRYEALSEENSGADFSNFDYVVFEIRRQILSHSFAFYEGFLNGKNSIAIHYPRTKYCPNFELRPYVTSINPQNKIITHLISFDTHFHSEDESKRLLRALDWFNKSYRSDSEVDNLERYMNLAIAFEALFNSPEEAIRASLSTAIIALLGETPEMVDWVKDFYNKRSDIAHGKEDPDILYTGRGSSTPHLHHLWFARKVFIDCVKAIFNARETVYTRGLHQELISNERRIREILTILRRPGTISSLYATKVFDVIDSLTQKDTTGSRENVIEIGKLLLPKIRSRLRTSHRNDLLGKLNEIISYNGTDLGELAILYGDFHEGFSSEYFGGNVVTNNDIPFLALKGAIFNFTSYATWRLLTWS